MAGPTRKSDQIRVIFRELRKAAGPEVPAADLIKLAHVIFRTYKREPEHREDRYGSPRFRPTIENMPVDVAMRDGGWGILYFEKEHFDAFAADTVAKRIADQRSVKKYLGERWPHQLVRG